MDGIPRDWNNGCKNYNSESSWSLILKGCILLYAWLIFPISLSEQGQRRQGGWTYSTGRVNPTDPSALWIINNTSGEFSQKQEMNLDLDYSRIALTERSKRERATERTQQMICRPLMFGGYFGIKFLVCWIVFTRLSDYLSPKFEFKI